MNRPFRAAAQRFLIWRFGRSVAWKCTYLEISEATGIDPKTVSLICRRFSYRTKADRTRRVAGPMPVDNFMSLGQPFMRNHY